MAMELLPGSLLLVVLSKTEPSDCCRAACVNRRWRALASDDVLWYGHCRDQYYVYTTEDPSGKPCSTFKETFNAWRSAFGQYPADLVYRARKCWMDIKAYMSNSFPAVADSLSKGGTEQDLAAAETALGCSLPPAVRLLYLFCNGQETAMRDDRLLGLFGGYYFYRHIANVQMLTLPRAVWMTDRFHRYLPRGLKRLIVAASANMNKFFFVDCTDGMMYVGTKDAVKGEMMPCVPVSENNDGMLRWLEEYRNRLLGGMYFVRNEDGVRSISLFPEKEPWCTEAVTQGVQVRCSAVFVPEMSTVGGPYCFAYSVRMRLLPVAKNSFSRCQLFMRHWIIKAEGVPVEELRAEAVVGMYPLLNEGGDVFVYESCSSQGSADGSMEGDFTFIPGTLSKPEGPQFLVKIAPFPLQIPQYIF